MKIKDICVGITDGSHNPPKGIQNSDYFMLSSKNIFDDEITFDNPRYLLKSDFEYENKRTKIKTGDVLFTIVGTVGRTAVVNNIMPVFTLQRSVAVLHPKPEICNSRYMMYALQAKRNYIKKRAKGVAQKGIYLKEVAEIDLKIPSVGEQINMVEVLDKIKSIIYDRKQELEKLEELIKSRFVEMFGDYYENHINEQKLNEICDFIDYRGKTPEKSESGIPLITAKNVKDNRFCIEPREFIPVKNYNDIMTRGVPCVNDVLFTTEAPLGNVCRIPDIYEKFCVGQRLITIQPHRSIINSEYLEFALSTPQFQSKMWKKSSGSTVKGIRSKLLILLTIPVPPLNLQNQFADFVHQIDKSKLTFTNPLNSPLSTTLQEKTKESEKILKNERRILWLILHI